jgi:hypothetical protein
MIVAAYRHPVVPRTPAPPPLEKKVAPDAGGEEASPASRTPLATCLDDLGRTLRARYSYPAAWARVAALFVGIIALGCVPYIGPLLCVPACLFWLTVGCLLALQIADGNEPDFRDVLARAASRVCAVVATSLWVLLAYVLWVGGLVLAGDLAQLVPAPLALLLGAAWFAGGFVYLFTNAVHALPAALVDGHVGPAATAASRRCWRRSRVRSLVGFTLAKFLANCELLGVILAVGLLVVPFSAMMALLAQGGPETLATGGPLVQLAAFGGVTVMGTLLAGGVGLACLAFPIHQVLVYRSVTQED